MHGSAPKLMIIAKKEAMGEGCPDFDGDSYLDAKKKTLTIWTRSRKISRTSPTVTTIPTEVPKNTRENARPAESSADRAYILSD